MLGCIGVARAEATVAPPPGSLTERALVRPDRMGYAFDEPEILLRQRLIGFAHGLRLLGRACLLDSAYSLEVEQAYSAWYQQQGATIDAMTRDLERWYFGDMAQESDATVRLREIVRILGLRAELRALSDEERNAACASFAQAIASERYDFVRLLSNSAVDPLPVPPPTSTEMPEVPAEPANVQQAVEAVKMPEIEVPTPASAADEFQQ